jgi:type VI secretion system protein ImpH
MNKLEDGELKNDLASLQRYDFFQAVRLLEAAGYGEKLFFKALPSLAFSVSAIKDITFTPKNIAVQVSFMRLTGQEGPLPEHYTELVLQRLQVKDTALRDFLDLFNHRLIQLFYRAWAKYRYYVAPEGFTYLLSCLTGNSASKQQHLDRHMLFYAGLLSKQIRSANNLEAILSDYFSVAVTVIPFQGKWLALSRQDRSQIGIGNNNYHQLSHTAVLGQRSWDMQNNFRLRIGPLTYDQFKQFLPGSHKLQIFIKIIQRYVSMELNFDLQLILKAKEVPLCQLRQQESLVLGWSAWLKSKPFTKDADNTVFGSTA